MALGLGKLRTGLEYAAMGTRVGADIRSKWTLASMLVRLKIRDSARPTNNRIYTATLKAGALRQVVRFRIEDIFIIHELFSGEGYLFPDLYEEPPACIIDLGAHIGLASIRFAGAFPEAVIHCYEPDPENFRLLKSNTSSLPNVVLHEVAVGEKSSKAMLHIQPNRHTASSLRPEKRTEAMFEVECDVKSLDDILSEVGETVDLIKFDIEAVKFDVFSHSILVQEVDYLVGEMKAPYPNIKRLCELFPKHESDIRNISGDMHFIYLIRK